MSDKLKKIIPIAFNGGLTRQTTSEALGIIMSGDAPEG